MQVIFKNPYREAEAWIEQHAGTGSATSLAKLVLSFRNADCAFSFRECISNLDERNTALAIKMVAYFARHGEDKDLCEVGENICKAHSRLWDLGQAADEARCALRARWREEDDRC
jgi:hypothetical protein